jgi:ATP-dependent Clp protease ATP-binding subunit ClpC
VTKEAAFMLDRVRQLVRSASEDKVSLTPRSEKAIQMAGLEARQLGHGYADTEHLLLGLLRESEGEPEGVAAQVLADLGVNYEEVRRRVSEVHGTDG